MAENSTDTRAIDDEPERRKAAGGVSLAEEAGDELPALLAIAVGIAVIVVILGGSTWTSSRSQAPEVAAVVEETTTTEAPADEEAEEAQAGIDDAALAALAGAWPDLGISAEGDVLTVSGEVADEAERDEVLAAAAAIPGVSEVIDELTLAPVAGSEVDVEASQAQIVLSGTVPSQELADELFARASAIYAEDQIDNQLVVDDGVTPPVAITITGATTDDVLHRQLLAAFDGIVGVGPITTDGFELQESTELESSLNTLEPIQFTSGSAQILPDSEPILDDAAEFLTANPDVSLEIGGHTDSIGDPVGNQTLSQSRADAVLAALQARGVENDLVARGFGETRLKEDPDDTAEKQQANRRIEFRIL
ncbi:MAG: OmpA family protein [Actinomycetota bacterium]